MNYNNYYDFGRVALRRFSGNSGAALEIEGIIWRGQIKKIFLCQAVEFTY